MKVAPQNPQLVTDRIAIEQAAGGLPAALKIAQELQKDPALPTATALEGDAYLAAGERAKAIEAYSKAFERTPSALLAMRIAGAMAPVNLADAAAGLRDWLAAHPDDTSVAELLANLDIQAKRFPEAMRGLEAVLAKTPDVPVALNNLAWLYQQAGDPRARAIAQRAYLLASGLPQTADTLGWILTQEGEAATAIGLLRQAAADEKASPAVRYHLAVALNATGRREESQQLLTDLIKNAGAFEEKPAAEKLLAELSPK
jgi:predicted Zn-dependent protease